MKCKLAMKKINSESLGLHFVALTGKTKSAVQNISVVKKKNTILKKPVNSPRGVLWLRHDSWSNLKKSHILKHLVNYIYILVLYTLDHAFKLQPVSKITA